MTSLKQAVSDCEILHPRFEEMLDIVTSRIDDALRGDLPPITWVVGPSRAGKSQLCRAIAKRYPSSVVEGRRSIPVAMIASPTSTTTVLLPTGVLNALGVSIPKSKKTAGDRTTFMYEQLALAGTKVLAFDEASQIVELGSKIDPFSASEWFKQNHNEAHVAQLLFGVARLERLFHANPQLRLRAFKKIVWKPYDISVDQERKVYITAVNTFLKLFTQAGWTLKASLETIAANCYLHAPGVIGGLSDLMKQLARQLDKQTPRALALEDFRAAADVLESIGHPNHPAFVKESVSMVELNLAYTYCLSANEMK